MKSVLPSNFDPITGKITNIKVVTPNSENYKKSHFSLSQLWSVIVLYIGALFLGSIPFLIGKFSLYLFDTGHWFWGIIVMLIALSSISIAWYGWIAAAALLIPLWLCTTSWWILGAIIFAFEAFFIYCCSLSEE